MKCSNIRIFDDVILSRGKHLKSLRVICSLRLNIGAHGAGGVGYNTTTVAN